MNMPKSGRVIIIDNKFEEVLPLIRILSKDRVATNFFSGRMEDLPSEPFTDVRMVFLDIVLEGLEGADDKTKISALVNVISKVVSKENGPFILAIWTKHSELTEKIQEALKEEGYYILIIDLEKGKFFKREIVETKEERWVFEEENIDNLWTEIKNKINMIDIFRVFINWENLIHNAASITVNEVSKLAEFGNQWNEQIKKVFYNLAKAWAGIKINDLDDKEKIRSALYAFHQIFGDVFERELQQINIKNISLEKGDIDDLTKGKINSRIILDINKNNDVYPGNIYKLEDLPSLESIIEKEKVIKDAINWNTLKQIYKKKLENSRVSKSKFNREFVKTITPRAEFVWMEITPICDFVQSKMALNRLVLGTIYPVRLSFTIDNIEIKLELMDKQAPLIKQRTEFLYVTPLFEYRNEFHFIVFDFHYFTSITSELTKDKIPVFRLRKELLSDIQVKLSSHINRTGVLYLD